MPHLILYLIVIQPQGDRFNVTLQRGLWGAWTYNVAPQFLHFVGILARRHGTQVICL